MATSKKNILVTLEELDIPSLRGDGVQQHLLSMDFIWPRLSIAKKNSTMTVAIVNGLCATDTWSLTNKLCFKESVEGVFGFHVALTETITATKIRQFLRYTAGKTANLASDAVEDAIPIPMLDEIAALPMVYLSKQLLSSTDPDLIAEGCYDMNAADFSDTPIQVRVPMVSKRIKLTKGKRVVKKDQDGFAVFSIVTF